MYLTLQYFTHLSMYFSLLRTDVDDMRPIAEDVDEICYMSEVLVVVPWTLKGITTVPSYY